MPAKDQQHGITFSLPSLFHGRSSISPHGSASATAAATSPKSPAPRLGVAILTSPTISIPGLSTHRTSSTPLPTTPEANGALRHSFDEVAVRPNYPDAAVLSPAQSHTRRLDSPRPSVATSVDEAASLDPVQDHASSRRKATQSGGRPRSDKKQFICKKTARLKLFRCLGAGVALLLLSGIYLGLALSGVITSLNLHILMACIGLMLIMIFVYSTIRLYLYVYRPPEYPTRSITSHTIVVPNESIPVVLRRDEESAAETVRPHNLAKRGPVAAPPPAYGRWRGSTRMDPNLVHWERAPPLPRAEGLSERESGAASQGAAVNRPPSYATEDGVDLAQAASPGPVATPLPPKQPPRRARERTRPTRR